MNTTQRRRIPTYIGASCLAAALSFSTGATIATAAPQAPPAMAEQDDSGGDQSGDDTGGQTDGSHPQGTDTGNQQGTDTSHPRDTDTGNQQGTDTTGSNRHPPDVVAPPANNGYASIGGSDQYRNSDGPRSPDATGTAPKYNEQQADLQMVLDFVNSECLNAGSLGVLPVKFLCLVDTGSQFVNGWYPKDAAQRVIQKYVRFYTEAPVNPDAKKSIDCSKYSGSTKIPDECFVGSSKQK
ncbi:hypothetical protein [Streptomyces sp. NPDC058623]|uniref:hypothetical protein n=1 Tax=Streptomyces sp. NPDC058623 TaxID=3346563 RepID=UPI0036686D14